MKKQLFYLVTIVIISYILQFCNAKIRPSIKGKIPIKTYDSTAFDYVFAEGLKQKYLGNAGDALKYLEQCTKINPKSDAAFFEMAQIALLLSDENDGKRFALKAVSLNEKNIWYLMLIANIYYQEKAIDSSIIYYEKAINYFPKNEKVKLNLADLYSEKRLYEKASKIYNYFEKKYGNNETTTILMIKNLINAGNLREAEEKVSDLLVRSPDDVSYNEVLAEIYRNKGEKEKACFIYKKLLDKDPINSQILLSVSDFLIVEKQYDDLFPILNKIILNDSISRENKISLFVRIISDSSLIKIKSNEIELTLLILEARNKNDDIILLLRPELYENQNNISKAIVRLEEIINDHVENYFAWERLLILYSETRNYERLLARGKECETKFNKSFLAKILYANASIELGFFPLAEEELEKAKILAGNDTGKLVQVMSMDADLLYRMKEYNKSFEMFREALKINHEDIIVMNNYAYYLAEQGKNLKEAEKIAKIVITKEKDNTTYLDTYAWVLYKRGKFKEAERIMEIVISKGNKSDAEWYEHYGYIMKELGKCKEAVEYWKLAFKLDSRKTSLLKEIKNCGNY